jgi:uncharacterized beta-barrel protein YwiB (DUF1934 family)
MPEDTIKMFTTGFLSGDNDHWRLRYTETSPDTQEKNPVTLTMEDGSVVMSRGREKDTSMVFTQGSRYEGVYRTPYGELDMAIFPRLVRYRIGQDSGEIALNYQLDFQGEYASDHELRILYANKSSKSS